MEGGREVLKNCGEDRVGGGNLCFPKIIFLVFYNIAIYFHNNIGGIQSHPFRNTRKMMMKKRNNLRNLVPYYINY